MGKEERKARRKARKAERKARRAEKQNLFALVIAAAEKAEIKVDLDEAPRFVDAFNQVWPVLDPALKYLKVLKFTGPSVDEILQVVIDLGTRVSTGDASDDEKTEFIKKLDSIWDPVKIGLEIIKSFTNDKVDAVIDDIIEVGDWITDNE